jgi:hypothetical protein
MSASSPEPAYLALLFASLILGYSFWGIFATVFCK